MDSSLPLAGPLPLPVQPEGRRLNRPAVAGNRLSLAACLLLVALLAGCRGAERAQEKTALPPQPPAPFSTPATTSLPSLSPSITTTPAIIPTRTPTLTSTPSPLFVFDLTGYDPDIFQPIDVMHRPPIIARTDETVRLAFDLVNTIYCEQVQRYCRLEPSLHYTYGEDGAFQRLPLALEITNGLESLVARLPVVNSAGKPLRYYAEFAVPEASYTLRYPVERTIDLFATSTLVPVELPAAKPAEPGDRVYDFFWGYGPDKVRRGVDQGGRIILAPFALDAAEDGSIALIDPVSARILMYDPNEDRYTSYAMPFDNNNSADLAFDRNGRLVICDFAGEYFAESLEPVRTCYRLQSDGELAASAPVYVKFPGKITKDLRVLDQYDYLLVAPFTTLGEPNSREIQRQKETWNLPYHYVAREQGFDSTKARFADIDRGVAFEIHSPTGIDGLIDFEKTPQGYLLVINDGFERVRAVWIDLAGSILKDVTLPQGKFTELSIYGQVAVTRDGSLYVLGSTPRGIEVRFVEGLADSGG